MSLNAWDDFITLSSGRQIRAAFLSPAERPDLGGNDLFEGFDSPVDLAQPLSPAERAELAVVMCLRWKSWAESNVVMEKAQ